MAQEAASFVIFLCFCLGLASAYPMPTSWCSWYSYSATLDYAGYCHLNSNYLLAISAEPTTWVGKQLTRAYGRNLMCSAYTTNTTCNAQAKTFGCSWNGGGSSSQQCYSTDASDWEFFSRHAYAASIPGTYLCAGSQAQQFKTCNDIGIDATRCKATKGCVMSQGYCQASFLTSMTQAQNDAWQAKFQALDPSVAGTCASVCYLRQLFQCDNLKDAAKCGANPYCQYSAKDKSCTMNQYGSDPWGAAASKASALCMTYNTSTTCHGPIGAVINTARVNKYKNWTAAGDASMKIGKCPV